MNEEQSQQPVQEPKRNSKPLVITLIVIALIAITGYTVYAVQQNKVNDLNSQVKELKKEASSLKSEVAELKEDTAQPVATSTTPAAVSEDSAILAAAKADAEANVNSKNVTVKIATKSGNNFARVSVSLNPTGYAAVLKKVNNTWVVVVKGQESPSKEDGATYGLPSGWFATDY